MNIRYFFLLAVFFGLGVNAIAQTNFLKNPGFETWNNNLPVSWITDTAAVAKSTSVKSGSIALKLKNYLYLGAVLIPGQLTQDVAVTGSNFSFKGWYLLNATDFEGLGFAVQAFKASQVVGAGGIYFRDPVSVYTAFACGVSMAPGATADTCNIMIFLERDAQYSNITVGSYALLDDLVLDNTVTGVSTQEFMHPSEYTLLQNFPNPFNPSTEIEFTIPNEQHVTLMVYNVMGQEIATLVNEQLRQGRYKKAFNASTLSSGTYFYKLQAGNFLQVKKMTVLK